MPERLDRVSVTTSSGTAALPWASRDKLLAEIRHLDSDAELSSEQVHELEALVDDRLPR